MINVRRLLTREIRLLFQRNVHLSRCYCENHYDVLNLPRNCSQKEIKTAFIKLSKKYHPDKNTDSSTHGKFVKLNEAYTVLSRPDSRREYDLGLVPPEYIVRSHNINYRTDISREEPVRPFRDDSFWENRDKSKDQERMSQPYYGIKGLKKVSNSWILTFLLLFTTIGVVLQFYLIYKSVTFSRKALQEESSRNAEILKMVRRRALAGDADISVLERLQRNSDAQDAATFSKRLAAHQDK